MSTNCNIYSEAKSPLLSSHFLNKKVCDPGNTTPFEISKEQLTSIVNVYINRESDDDLKLLVQLLGTDSNATNRLCDRLKTGVNSGISTTNLSLVALRRENFGTNVVDLWESTSFYSFITKASQDGLLRILIVCGCASIILSVCFGEPHGLGWIDGAVIFVAVIVVILITAVNDYFREQQFRSLHEKKISSCLVTRDGCPLKINVEDLMVGDVMMVESGDEVFADCIVLTSYQFSVDESSLTGESVSVHKMSLEQCRKECNEIFSNSLTKQYKTSSMEKTQPSPVILAGSIVSSGTAKLLVLAVGSQCQIGRLVEKLSMDTESTPLKIRLNNVGRTIGRIAMVCGCLVFFIHIIEFWLMCYLQDNGSVKLTLRQIVSCHVEALIESITLLVVSIPEGLPLAVTLALAYSVNRMLDDKSYVRNLAACETLGEASEICLDKTGTLTENVLSVKGVWNGTELFLDEESNFGIKKITSTFDYIPKNCFDLCVECILFNSTAYYRNSETSSSQPKKNFVGCSTECALMTFLEEKLNINFQHLGRDYQDDKKIIFRIPFDSSRKVMFTVVKSPDDAGIYRIYAKGAAEIVLDFCSEHFSGDGSCAILDSTRRAYVGKNVIQKMGREGLRTLCLAYKDVAAQDIETIHFDSDFKCLLIVGLRDSLRKDVISAVHQCQSAGIHVRMITGDNIDTAKRIGQECNIYRPNNGSIALTGKEFYEKVGGLVCMWCKTESCDCLLNEKQLKHEGQHRNAKMNATNNLIRSQAGSNGLDTYLTGFSKGVRCRISSLWRNLLHSVNRVLGFFLSVIYGANEMTARNECLLGNQKEKISMPANYEIYEKALQKPFDNIDTVDQMGGKVPADRRRIVRVDTLGNMDAFQEIVDNLDIIARAHPKDKYAFVVGLKALGAIVAATGDGANDALALKKADVGVAMGLSGKEIAKQAADVVLLDDQFSSIVKAVMWGRNIYENISRFIQFQLVVNASTVFTTLSSSIIFGESPFNTAQLLWVNLIMDTFASLALGTEVPTDECMKVRPRGRNEPLIDQEMAINITIHVAYQMAVIGLLIFTGECWIPEHQNTSYSRFQGENGFSQFSQRCGQGHTVAPGYRFAPFSKREVFSHAFKLTIGPSRHYTIVYNTFVFLQIFTLINTRKNSSFRCSSWREFQAIFLWALLISTICMIQYIFVQYGGIALNSHVDGLTLEQWALSIALSSSVILFDKVLRFILRTLTKSSRTISRESDKGMAATGHFGAPPRSCISSQLFNKHLFTKRFIPDFIMCSFKKKLNKSYTSGSNKFSSSGQCYQPLSDYYTHSLSFDHRLYICD